METKRDRTAIVALVAGGIALLLGLCLGALGGGAAGYLIGRQVEGRATDSESAPSLLPETPATPELPELPALPRLPDGLTGITGALIREVIADSPAEKAGLRVYDLITAVDDMSVGADHPLATVIAAFRPGDRVEMTVIRNGETLTVNLTLGKHPDNPSQAYVGVRYVDVAMPTQRPGD